MNNKIIVVDIISALFIILFVYAALNKLADVQKFQVQIGQSPMLTGIAPIVAWGVPISEILISVLLAIQRTRLFALFAAYGIMVMFTAYIIALLQFDGHIPCSCGGILQNMSWTEHLIFNISFSLFGLIAILILPVRNSIKQPEKLITQSSQL